MIFKNVELNRDEFSFKLNAKFDKNGIYGVIGPNGCGKTTFLEIATGILWPNNGKVLYAKESINAIPISMRNELLSVSYVNEPAVPFMRVKEFLKISLDSPNIFQIIKKQYPYFARFLNKPLSHLSQGQWIMIQMLQNILQNTPFIFIDELFLFLDIKMKDNIFKFFDRKNKKIFILSHDIDFILKNSDYILALKNGKQFFYERTRLFTCNLIDNLFE
ncbi:ABC transporter ATP-binding protein [bacterium]|nr:ABC transporter ATP-binding protein [bacterium]